MVTEEREKNAIFTEVIKIEFKVLGKNLNAWMNKTTN